MTKKLDKYARLLEVAKQALSALETPDDLSKKEFDYVIEDLIYEIKQGDPAYFSGR